MTDAMLAFELAPGAHGLSWPDAPRAPALFARARGLGALLRETAPAPLGAAPERQWTRAGAAPMGPRWARAWSGACCELRGALDELRAAGRAHESVLGYLCERIGHESGALLRAMHDARVSWGTYQDAMCADGQWHCNAHTNNLVALSPGEGARALAARGEDGGAPPLLAYLDLDMAFSEANFVDVATGRVGAAAADFDRLLARERINFAEVLAGADASSGVPQVALAELDARPAALRGARNLLSDTLVRAYLEAYDERAPPPPCDPLLHRGAYAVMTLAIIVMADCEA